MSDYSYIGVGKVYLREYGSAEAMRAVGNVTDLNFNVTEDSKELKDFTNTGGGTHNEARRVEGRALLILFLLLVVVVELPRLASVR